ncbi:MAG: GH25 family lysozyme [Pseudonocardiaceae bacterium]
MIFGVDIHPQYQAGISIEQIRAEGFDFMAVKVSEGTNDSFLSAGSADWLRRGKAAGLLCLGYHYLRPGNEDAQARIFVSALAATGVAGMLDVETGSGDIGNVRTFLGACSGYGGNVPLLYLPYWYWQQIGSPSLSGLPALWASHYVSGSGTAAVLYAKVANSWWAGYGGGNVEVLQFTDQAQVAGRQIDADAYRGTRDQFASLIKQPAATVQRSRRRTEENTMVLPATTDRIDMQVPTDVVGGWCGNANLLLTANTGGATVYGVYAVADRGATAPLVTPILKNDAGQNFAQWWPLRVPLAAGTTSVVVNYTAPSGMVAHIEYEH